MKKFLIWGTGAMAEACYRSYSRHGHALSEDKEIICFVDNDTGKKEFHGKPVITPSEIRQKEYDYIDIWTNAQNEDEIKRQIAGELGISEDKIADFFSEFKQKLNANHAGSCDREVQETLDRISQERGLRVYYFENKDTHERKEAFYDGDADLYYILFEGKRMYLKRAYPLIEKDGRKYAGDMWHEQDPNSPHLYEEGSIQVEYGDVLVDAGVCEGNFSLHNIDKVKRAYLIECNKEWMEALHHTFLPYRDKVVFCQRFLSDRDSEGTVRLDTLVKEAVNFIKMDIEGEEVNALRGGVGVLQSSETLKCAICSYHRHGDERRIREILQGAGMRTEVSKGYMLFLHDRDMMRHPELRRGIVRGSKGGTHSQ